MFKLLNKDEYANEMLLQLQRGGISPLPRYDSQSFSLEYSYGNEVNLVNFYADYCAAPFWKRAQFITHVGSLMVNTEKEISSGKLLEAPQRTNLLPSIRDRIVIEKHHLDAKLRKFECKHSSYKPIGEHLSLAVVNNTPNNIVSTSNDDYKELGITFDEALEIANTNLLNLSPPKFRQIQEGLFVSEFNDSYDASRMHLTQLFSHLKVKGRAVAMIPNRDKLFITGSEDQNGLYQMAKMAEKIYSEPRPISGFAYRLDAVWTPFLPEVSHPAYLILKSLATANIARTYSAQHQIIEKYREENDIDIFVDDVETRKFKNSGVSFSYAAWGNPCFTLLPETDFIIFISEVGARPLVMHWKDVIENFSNYMYAQGYYPERYLVKDFPPIEEVKARAHDLAEYFNQN